MSLLEADEKSTSYSSISHHDALAFKSGIGGRKLLLIE